MPKGPKVLVLPEVPLRKGEKLDDDSVFYRAMKEYKRLRRVKSLTQANKLLESSAIPWMKHTAWHWSTDILGERLQYWPSTTKFLWKGRTRKGDLVSVEGFIRNRIREMSDAEAQRLPGQGETSPTEVEAGQAPGTETPRG